jgi:hypothetical protein
LDAHLKPFGPPETGTALASETTMQRDCGRRVTRDLATGECTVQFDWHANRVRIVPTDTEMGEENSASYRIAEGDPLSATVNCATITSLAREGWNTRVEARTKLTCDRDRFIVTASIDAYADDVRVHARTETLEFPRDGV